MRESARTVDTNGQKGETINVERVEWNGMGAKGAKKGKTNITK